ncbi:MAG: flavin reductase [Gammaproteobacteria bacterium]|nr:flavin reductase [Gammaproteobacteria bacterium]
MQDHTHNESTPFIHVDTVDNFYQASAFIPMSFALVTTVHENGETSIGPHALIFPFSVTSPHSMMLISRNNSGTAHNIRRTSKCSLNYIEFDRNKLQGISNMGVPGMSFDEKLKANPYTLIDSPSPEKATDPDAPKVIEEAFQVIECTWHDSFDLHKRCDDRGQPYDGHFNLLIDNILVKDAYASGLAAGSTFPNMPVFCGFRENRQFWFADTKPPIPVELPEIKGAEWQSVYYLANRIDNNVQFTEEACKQLTGIPSPFIKQALTKIIENAKDENISMVDAQWLTSQNNRSIK